MKYLFALVPFLFAQEPVSLFDGKTFDGWEGDTKKWWRLQDGALVGGSLKEQVPHNDFLATTREYENFILRLKFRLLGTQGFINSGVQVRSQRAPKGHEMIGYQCDLGDPSWWGSIYDESRRNRVLAQSDMKAVNAVLKRGDWNDYEIRAEGPRLVTLLNGVVAVDYTEEDDSIPLKGRIGFQIHGGGAAEAWFKEITIRELPPTPPSARFVGAPDPGKATRPSPMTPEEAKASFTLPPGFEIELVSSEVQGVSKPISVAWDASGRLWTMTAVEYPVDANEDPQRSAALFRDGGRDRVLVFDAPHGPGPHAPRVWAEKLAIPLGLLPYRDGAFVQYGNELRFYRDRDADGRADGFDTVLRGFGTEDSHLFIHQFTRGPGGWIYLAQGAFNRTRVKTLEGPEVRWDFCKMARMQPDGSRFELCQAGLNNIWGFVITREGEMFIQEANDLGYPVVPFPIGANYPGIGMEKLRPYAPWQPALANHFQMGGTGLSGLARAEDRDGWPEPYAGAFYIANPITRKIQAVRARADGPHHRLSKLPDFLLCSDEWFRPIAIHFGPDGCLYIADWYNKIISHNEVPRNHPERDKTRGRIWRIRHKDQARRAPPDLARASEADLLMHLDAPGTWESRTAWTEIVDRGLRGLEDDLVARAKDPARAADLRLRALWALEGLGKPPAELLHTLAADPGRNVRREAVRCAARLAPADALAVARRGAEDPDPQVRAEAIRTLSAIVPFDAALAEILVRLAREPLDGPRLRLQQGGVQAKTGAAHDRDFERYLVRAALERHPAEVAASLDSPAAKELPVEGRLLASLALEPNASVPHVAALLPRLGRPPDDEELLRLAEFVDRPEAAGALRTLLGNPGRRSALAEALLRVRNRLDAGKAAGFLSETAGALWEGDEPSRDLAVRLGAAFRITALEEKLAALLASSEPAARRTSALRALREMASARVELFAGLVKDPAFREEALFALAAAPGGRGAAAFLALLPDLNARERRTGLDRLAATAPGAQAIVRAFREGALPTADFDGPLLERLQAVLGNDAGLRGLLETNASLFRPVLALDGKAGGFADLDLTLAGPFTVESWIRLEKGITNTDALLGAPNVNFNFHDAKFRVWGGPRHGDVVVARKAAAPEVWTHVALTRDAEGRFRIYFNGELDQDQGKPLAEPFTGLDLGWTHLPQGTAGRFDEFRVWDHARSAEEIRAGFDRSFEGEAEAPKGLVRRLSGAGPWGTFKGGARVVKTTDFPSLVGPVEAKALEEKFRTFRGLAEKPGDAGRGRELFTKTCAACHTAEGRGGQIGPALNGAGAMGTEALLRNLLTPNASMEPGYRTYRLQTRGGDVLEGFLVSQDGEALVLRQPGTEDRRIAQKDVRQAGYTRRSLMPEGLLEGLKPEQVAELFAYLKTLK